MAFILTTFLYPCSSVGEESPYSAGAPDLIPVLERSPEEGNDNPLQYSCLKNPTCQDPLSMGS